MNNFNINKIGTTRLCMHSDMQWEVCSITSEVCSLTKEEKEKEM